MGESHQTKKITKLKSTRTKHYKTEMETEPKQKHV